MLDSKEIELAKELLKYVEMEDLVSLTRTTTNDIVIPTTREEAVSAIILHTDNLELLLSRKKVTKEVLFKFLHDRNQPVSMSSEKLLLQRRVLEISRPGQAKVKVSVGVKVPEKDCAASDDSGAATGGESDDDLDDCRENQNSVEHTSTSHWPRQLENTHVSEATSVNPIPGPLSATMLSDFPVTEFAQQFVRWFYDRLNSGDLGPEHFWSDAAADFMLQPGDQVSRGVTSQGVSELLGWVHNQLGLLFNPNCDLGGVRGKAELHGLVVVLACGTLHMPDRCVGIFTQQFSLARDPFMNNSWKVKNTRAILRQAVAPPLGGSAPLPALDSSNPDLMLLEMPMVDGCGQ